MEASANIIGDHRPVLLLVDGHAYAYRAFYAIRSLSSPTGQPTNAIYGFVKMLQKLITYAKPSHVAIVWDGGLAAERQKLLPEYKAQRPAMPSELESQLDEIVAYLKAAGLASLCEDGLEADDWIARLALEANQQGAYAVIASADKDFFQLINADLALINPNDKEPRLWTALDVETKTGVKPEQVVDWLSLLGDAVDNIPGVPGVGLKTATDLLVKFGSLEGIYSRLAEVKTDRIRNALIAAKQDVYRNREMVRLWKEAGREVPFEDLRPEASNDCLLADLFRKWGFRSLLQEIEQGKKQAEPLLC